MLTFQTPHAERVLRLKKLDHKLRKMGHAWPHAGRFVQLQGTWLSRVSSSWPFLFSPPSLFARFWPARHVASWSPPGVSQKMDYKWLYTIKYTHIIPYWGMVISPWTYDIIIPIMFGFPLHGRDDHNRYPLTVWPEHIWGFFPEHSYGHLPVITTYNYLQLLITPFIECIIPVITSYS